MEQKESILTEKKHMSESMGWDNGKCTYGPTFTFALCVCVRKANI